MTLGDITIGQLTVSSLLLLVILLVLRAVIRGDWIPRRTNDVLLSARDAEIERAIQRGNEWHDAYEAQRHRAELLLEQNNALIEVARTVQEVVAKVSRNGAETA